MEKNPQEYQKIDASVVISSHSVSRSIFNTIIGNNLANREIIKKFPKAQHTQMKTQKQKHFKRKRVKIYASEVDTSIQHKLF